MVEIIILKNFLIAIALGALIGLEREYAKQRRKAHAYAGIRTYPLIALFGAAAAYLGVLISPWILVVSILLIGGLIISAYFSIAEKSTEYLGATSEMAGFLTFFIGVLSYYGELSFAVAMAIVITIILYAKSVLHHFAKRIKKGELRDTLKFAVIAFVILPFLPNQNFGPLGLFNPYVIWLMVVFISGISFVGYILMKWFGERGIELAGILGGLVSSTAVTSSFANRSKKEKKLYIPLALGVILANTIMFVRILIEVYVINRPLFYDILFPMSLIVALSALFAIGFWFKAKKAKGKVELSSPFTLGPALKFGIFFAVILALVKVADLYLSSKGVYIVSVISGFADVDAITVSLSQIAKGELAFDIAKRGIILAALTNVGVKGGIAYLFGGKKFGRAILVSYIIIILAGLAVGFLF